MRLDDLYLWYLGEPERARYVGALKLAAVGKGVALRYGAQWLAEGLALSEDLPLVDTLGHEQLERGSGGRVLLKVAGASATRVRSVGDRRCDARASGVQDPVGTLS